MRDKLAKFMYGRYGVDDLGRYLLGFSLFLCIISMLFRNFVGSYLYFISMFLIFYMYIRMFSRNVQKRYSQNVRFIKIKNSFMRKFKTEKSILSQRRYYHFYRCPRCNQKIRIPRRKGRIEIRCPKCNERFIRKS